jgi:hypothetical protein
MSVAGAAFTGYRRRVRIVPHAGRIQIEMEDDAHHFGVSLHHDGTTITAVETSAPRFPWTTCPAAGAFLVERMTGVALADAARVDNQRDHCTHVYDLFVIAARHALDDTPLTYDVRVSDPGEDGRVAEIDLDGETILSWRFEDQIDPVSSLRSDRRAFDAWTRALPPEQQEAGLILRRGVLVSGTRFFDFPVGAVASGMGHMLGACFTFQAGRADEALRVADTIRDFSKKPEKMLSGESDDQRAGGPAGH